MMRRGYPLLVLVWFCVPIASAQVTEIGPFAGELADSFESYWPSFIGSEGDVFDGAATLRSTSGETRVHFIAGSELIGDAVFPRTGRVMAGVTEPALWEFNTPAIRFGGYFDNNSGADDATADFYDVDGGLIDSRVVSIPVADDVWVWRGWESDVPIGSIVITGNGIERGFIWYDDIVMDVVPEPAAFALLLIGAAAVLRR
jgi:hypothetical protein